MIRQRRTARTGEAVTAMVVERVSAAVRGRSDGRVSVEAVTLVGSVEVDAGRLAVAVLLAGPLEEIPVRLKEPADGWLAEVGCEVRLLLERAGWPATTPVVFDGAERVAAGGGAWRYFAAGS